MIKRVAIYLLLTTYGGLNLAAQITPVHSFGELQGLIKPGETITVIDRGGKSTTGRLDSISATSVRVVTANDPKEFTNTAISQITKKRHDALWNGAIIGLIAGAAVAGFASNAATSGQGCNDTSFCRTVLLAGAAAGLGIGTALDLAKGKRDVVYTPTIVSRRIEIVPVLSKWERGFALTARF